MLMERKLTIRETLCVRWLFSLITMLLVSVGMQAENYGLTVAGVSVTDANANNITGTNITGTVSFSNGTLTLNEATINGSIVSDNTLTVHLIGRNVIHNTSAAFQIAGSYGLSFTATDGATLFTDATTDADFAYSVGNKSAIELGYYDLPYGEDYSYKLSYDAALKRCLGEYYGIDIYAFTNDASSLGPQNITAANCDKLAGYYNEDNNTWNNSIVTLSYDKSSNTLTMNNMNLESAMDCYLFRITEEQAKNVTIYLQGNNKLRQFNGEYGMGLITIDGSIDKAITITTDANNPGSLSMEDLPYEESTVIGATATYKNGLAYSKDGSTHYIEVPATSYGITIAGVGVTNRNAANVLADDEVNDGKVSFDATTNTLTLNGAKIDRSDAPVESCAITYVGSEDLTIKVYGTGNELIGAGGCEAIRYDGYGSSNPRLIFAKGNSQTCELYLKGNGVVSGFDDVDFGGLNLLSENDPGIHWDDYSQCLKSYDGNSAGEVTLTSAEAYPLWVWYNNYNQSHIQVTAANKANIMGENDYTVSFDGNQTLTLNNAAFTELNEQSAIIVGPSMTALSVNLVGASTINGTDLQGFYFVNPSILTFTTNESTPGSLTMIHGSIVDSGNNNITLNYKNGLGRSHNTSQQDVINTTGWVRSLLIDGVSGEITEDYTSQDESVKYVAATHTLTLNNATITGGISSNIDHLTINLVGTNSIGYIGSDGSAATSVEFTGNGTLTFSWQDGVMLGFSSVDFGEYNLLSNSTPGIHWDEMTKALRTHDNNAIAGELTLTKDEVYPIWLYDAGSEYHYRQITAENKTNVLGDDLSEEGSEPTVRFDDSNNTLTLNWAQIDMSNSPGQCAVASSIDNLKVKLLRYNTVTVAENNDSPSYVFRYIGKNGNAQLTFETEASEDGSYGSISASGIQVLEDLARNYTITNQLLDANVNPKPEQTGWHHVEETGYYKSVRVSYVEYYDLWMGGGHINSGNLMPVSGGTAYIPATHTLHLSGYGYSDVISSKMPELIVEVEGSNNLSGFSYTGTGNGRIVFRAAENSWSANSVTMSNDDGVIVGFNEVVVDEPLRVTTPATASTTWTADIQSAVISDDMSIEIGDIRVTQSNKNNVLGDGTVSYNDETHTLTLNNATINWSEQGESTGIDYSGTADLTIKLIGTNKIKGTGGCEAIRYNGEEQETLPKLIFANGNSLPCSLQLETTSENKSVIKGFGEVRGVNGIGSATGSLTISPSGTVYNPDPGLYTISEQEQIQLQVPVSSATISAESVLTVAGVGVTASGNVFTEGVNAGKVTFDADNNKLTLNGAVLDGGIEWNSSANLTIELNGENSITCSNETNAFKAVIEGAYPTLAFVKAENATSASLTLTVPNSMNTISGFNYPISHEGMFMIDDENETVCTTLITSAILSGGSGTSADPFIIETAADLKNFSEYIEESIISNTSCAKLSDDISQNGLDCSSVTIEPIGYGNIFFAGTFDGNGKTIKNLTIADDAGSCVGFFRILGANGTIKDLTIDNLTLSGGNSSTNNIGGLVGYLNGGTISNCTIKNSTISCKNDSQSPTVGGLVGELSSGSITNCTVQACTVNAVTEDTGNSGPVAQAGGIVGNASGGTISGCQVKGATVVLADYGEYEASVVAGAIVGRIGSATLSNNTYEYPVSVTTEHPNNVTSAKSDYAHRGTNAQTDPTGISLYTKPVVLPAGTAQATVIGEQDTYYATVEIGEGLGILVAPGQIATLNAIPENGYAIASLTATNNTTSEAITTTATAMGGNEMQYTFTMPDDSVTVTMTTAQAYGIKVAGITVTEQNSGNVLGDDKVSYNAQTHTLTLNNATIGNDGSDPEPMEVCGIDYSETADLTISLKGTNTIYGMGGCEAIRYNGGEQTHPKLIFTKGDNQKCSLQLNTSSDYERTAISGGFSEIQGVWGVGATDNGLAIIANKEVKYDSEDGLTIEKVVNYTVNYVPLSSTLIASYYGLTISGVPVYEGNKESISGEGIYGNGTASFDPTTNTLTLNNVNLNPDYAQNDGDLRVSIVTSLAQLNINLIGESQTYAIKATNEDCQLTFQSAETNRGAAKLNFWYNAEPYYIGFGENKVIYDDGLCLRESWSNSSFPKIVALDVPKVVTEEKERGLYYPDHEFTFSMQEEIEGFDIYYANMLGGDPVKTTNGKFTLAEGRYTLRAYPIYPGMDTDPGRNSQFASEIYAKVIAKPTFSKEADTYNEGFTLTLQNVPEQDAREEWADSEPENILVPQVWYYLDDNKNDSIRYDATKGISVTESCKVSVYVIDVDSAKKLKSTPVEAQYVIRQDAGLAYANEVAEYVIGGKDNEDLPELTNENNVAVTYTSDDEQVATVDETGKVTIVGIGETTITASSAQTATLLEGEASYLLRVYKDLNYESITVSVATATYTGEAVEPEVTVMDGETDITDLMIISYDNNVEVGDEASVTIVPNDDLEVNFYVGSRTKTFSIINRTLEIGKDVNFANGQKWASFYTTTENLELPDGVMAYIVTGVSNSAVSVKAINYVPKNVPVLIEKESTATTENTSAEGNLLHGTAESTGISGIEGNVYVLYNAGFTRATSGAIPAYRAYLVLEQNAGARLSIFEDDATGIGAVANSQQQKANDQYYDMQGRKVESHAKKGLYIKNGRKVVVK